MPNIVSQLELADIETSSEDYASRFNGKVGIWFLYVQAMTTLSMIAQWPRATVLDVGGGHGQLTKPLIENGYQVTVLGSSAECRNRIQKFLAVEQCEFRTGNVINLPFEDQSFDIVLSFRLVAHVRAWEKLLCELARVARKAVIIDYPTVRSTNSLTPLFFSLKKRIEGNTRYYTCYREVQLVSAMREAGFIMQKRFPQFFLPMVLHRRLKIIALSKSMEFLFRFIGMTALFGSPVILLFCRRNSSDQ